MPTIRDSDLVHASVPESADFGEAAASLAAAPVSTIAVLDGDERVVGLFGGEELIRAIFPAYLSELHHTAFARGDLGLLTGRASEVKSEPVEKHMHEPMTVERTASATHVAERFLHCELPALAVVSDGRFVGMLDRDTFCRVVLDAS